jgi:glucosyl-3-phosphoglycerate synthase
VTDPSPAAATPRVHHHADFDVATLLAHKEATGARVSVVIPALNEAGRVGHVVTTLRHTVTGAVPLVDELLVVDGGSQDRTATEAAEAGATVVRQADVLPEHGNAPGKGEALWKGLAATTGDLVVFVDADIVDIGPRFVVGLLGPLLTDPAIAFVKAAYDRPLRLGDVAAPTGGGRVTELMARPLLAAFWPDLAAIHQPLSGEYAGRRELLESLPFVQGYGVEIALLIDIAEQHGADVIAQVDLDRREHDHQDLAALGRMASEILHVALDRLARYGRAVFTDAPAATLLQQERVAGALQHVPHEVRPAERPPLASLR